jgi:hypothetical protein
MEQIEQWTREGYDKREQERMERMDLFESALKSKIQEAAMAGRGGTILESENIKGILPEDLSEIRTILGRGIEFFYAQKFAGESEEPEQVMLIVWDDDLYDRQDKSYYQIIS